MKNKILCRALTAIVIIIFASDILEAQVPQAINYQAVLRNSAGTIMQNQPVTIKFTIHQGSVNGATVYDETHIDTTNTFGLVNLQIGQGSPLSGTFSAISWGTNSYYLEVGADTGAGNQSLGTTQFITVPYAMVAGTVLPGGGGESLISAQTDTTPVTIPGGTLGTNDCIEFEASVSFPAEQNINPSFEVKYGGITCGLVTFSGGNPISDRTVKGILKGYIFGTGATNTQHSVVSVAVGNGNVVNQTDAGQSTVGLVSGDSRNIVVDSSVNQLLSFTLLDGTTIDSIIIKKIKH